MSLRWSPRYWWAVGLAALVLVLYLPYVLQGGFIIDDWGVIYNASISHGLLATYKTWFPLFSNRPLAPVFISITSKLFGLHPAGYIIINTGLLIASLVIMARVLVPYFGERFAVLLVGLGSVPIIASVVVFSPIMQITATASYFMWALAFWCIARFTATSSKAAYWGAYTLILAAFLTYEIILPLLVLLFFLPAIIEPKRHEKPLRYLLQFGLPLVIVLIVDLIYQKKIMPHFMQVFSRWEPVTHFHVARYLAGQWLYATFVVPVKLFGRAFTGGVASVWSIVTIGLAWVGTVVVVATRPRPKHERHNRYTLAIVVVTFGASVMLYLLTSKIPNTVGYDNRGLSSSWITEAIVVAFLASWPRKVYLTAAGLLILGCSWLAFASERTSYITSYQEQLQIVKTCIQQAHAAHIPAGATILGDVPAVPTNAFNGEDLFNNYWDFGWALYEYSGGYIAQGDTLTKAKLDSGNVSFSPTEVMVDGYWPASYTNLWLYTYNPATHYSALRHIANQAQLENALTQLQI